ncbi:hypothetical protein CSB37_02050 [bacterium DOLZORAL124_38_8]|nr:MAG: hypothetical protein CSB37_02050 [bacterium DOLZORAL124_38_8]
MGIAQYNSYIEKARLAKAQAAATQFKRQALAANASMNDKLFTAWYDFENDFLPNGNVGTQITDKSSSKNNLRHSNQNLTKSITAPFSNNHALTIKNGSIGRTVENSKPLKKITFALWTKIAVPTQDTYPVFIENNTGISARANHIVFYINKGNFALKGENKLKINKWQFIVGSYDGTTARLWIDGEFIGGKTIKQTKDFGLGGLYLGYHNFNGHLDDVMLIPYGYDGEKFY